jgi:RNA polymerase sigma-70 factor (sigma-E family)
MNPSGSDTVRAVTSSSGGLEELYARHVPSAVILARLLTGEAAAAEDIAHEGFIRAAGRFEHLRDVSNFDAYLRRTVVNLCHARGRSLVRERAALRRARAIPATATHDHDPEERDVVWSAIQRLPFRQRAAVVLRYYEDRSEADTARTLGCSDRAVNALVSRAMSSLRAELREEEP